MCPISSSIIIIAKVTNKIDPKSFVIKDIKALNKIISKFRGNGKGKNVTLDNLSNLVFWKNDLELKVIYLLEKNMYAKMIKTF